MKTIKETVYENTCGSLTLLLLSTLEFLYIAKIRSKKVEVQ